MSPEKELSELERLLAALPPRPAALNRDHLLYRAGQASMRRSWAWPFATVLMSVATGCLAMVLVLRPAPEPVVRVVHVHVPLPVHEPAVARAVELWDPPQLLVHDDVAESTAPTISYWRMQQQAIRFGVEGLPSAALASDGSPGAAGPIEGGHLSAGTRFQPTSSYYFGEP